ncbi:MAG TPA: hypothetical protein VJ208_00630 [Candidatus Nanoarchaeia archaeon]|nr:hypothetical protein [Candidatus Nanoarchaeia archaeon]
MNKRDLILFVGIVIIIISAYLYLKKIFFGYYLAPFGIWLFFDYLSHKCKNKTTFDLIIQKNYAKIVKLYLLLFIAGFLIELAGIIFLKLWTYKIFNYEPTLFSLSPIYLLGILTYPFILASFRESYKFLEFFLKNKVLTTIVTMFIGIIIWEVPNIFSKNWIYTIPFVGLEIFDINITVIIGWVILIWTPLLIYRYLKIK